jgi:glutamate---cysteine ligase / carboxylate-amine ligase
LPGLAASSPICDEKATKILDTRLEYYRNNSKCIPSITGQVIPEPCYARADYQREILDKIYNDIAPLDPGRIMQHEWLNARGAIARFERGSIEIRILDSQECPAADLAIGMLMAATLQALCNEQWTPWKLQSTVPTALLAKVFNDAIRLGPAALVPESIASHFGSGMDESTSIGTLWNTILMQLDDNEPTFFQGPLRDCLETILRQGTLSQRILQTLAGDFSRPSLHRVYEELCDCLENGSMFLAE